MLRSDLCDYSDAYIVVKENIIVNKKTFAANDIEKPNNTPANVTATNTENDSSFGGKKNLFKNNGPVINCFSKINGIKVHHAEDFDVVMSTYSLLKYSNN